MRSVYGNTEPRLWTPPLRELTPATSYGFDVCDFSDEILGEPLDPWEQWLVIHAGELLEDGRPRFRIVLVLVARQNGKTHVLVVLTLYWLFIECVRLVLGTSTKLPYAAESWRKACRYVRRIRELRDEVPRRGGIREANGEQTLWRADEIERHLDEGSRYMISAANDDAGRSLTIDRAILDELRQHHDYSAWSAVIPAMNAVPDAQAWAISNAGNSRSVVLNEERASVLETMRTGIGDKRVGLFEWSSPPDASPTDVRALVQANPNLNRRIYAETLLGDAATAVRKGGVALAKFKTEVMCITANDQDPAVDMVLWGTPADEGGCLDTALTSLSGRIAMCFDVSIDGDHATLYAAVALSDGRVQVDPVAAWSGPVELRRLPDDLSTVIDTAKPAALGWFPSGPAAAYAAELSDTPEDVTVEAIRGDVAAACMGMARRVTAGAIAHAGDPLLEAHLAATEKLHRGDVWVFGRKGSEPVDAAYAAAGAIHLALTLPEEEPPPAETYVV